MALHFIDGFDTATAIARILEKWGTSGVSPSIVAGRTGINALSFGVNEDITSKAYTVSGGFVVGTAFKIGVTPTSLSVCLSILEGATRHFNLAVDTTMHLVARRDVTTLATSSTTLSLNTWYYLEVKGTIHDTTGSYDVRIDEATFGGLSGTNQDTRNGATGVWDRIKLSSTAAAGATFVFDDLYLCDTGSGVNIDFLGDSKVDTLLPQTDAVAAGSNADFTPSTGTDHGALVDETNPNSTDYNSSNTAGHIDSYNYPVMVLDGTIRAVQVSSYMLKTDAGARTVSAMTRISGVNYIHATAITPTTSFAYEPQVFETSPATAGAWIVSEVNGAEFGLKVIS